VGSVIGTTDLERIDLEEVIHALRGALRRMGPNSISSTEAARLVEAFAEGERLCAAGKAMAARVVERSGVWRQDGHRSAAHWMAEATGVAVGQAVGTLETARRLEHLPATADAFCSGELSEAKVKEVAAAGSVSPSSEGELLQAARTQTVASLKDTCARARAEAAVDEDERYRRIHRSRFLRHYTDHEGAFRLEARLTPDDGARVLAGMQAHRTRITTEARKAGRRESSQALAADALVAMASGGSSPGPRAVVHVRVDHSALVRGKTARGEVCEIPGIGPIPVGAVRMLAQDAVWKAVLTDGEAVTAVAHLGRTIPAHIRTALQERDPTCVVPGCDVREGLEIDHVIPFAEGGPTTMENLGRLCHWHHYLKTFCRYLLGGEPGAWTWTGPKTGPKTGPDPPD
jgi:hypothetical protein